MSDQDKEIEQAKRFILDSFRAESPVFITTSDDKWISGYVNEQPTEFYFIVLDMRLNKPVKIMYSRISKYKEFEGDFTKLPLPTYLSVNTKGEGIKGVKAHLNSPSDSDDAEDKNE